MYVPRDCNIFLIYVCDFLCYRKEKGLGIKNMSDLMRKEIYGIFETKNPAKDQVKKYKRCENVLDNNFNATFVYVRSDLISRIIKDCRGEKKGRKNNNMILGVN